MAYVNSWCGAPTSSSFSAVAKITGATTATLHVSTDPSLSGADTFAMTSPYADVWRGEATGLTASTQYYWGVSQDGGAATQVGSARTAPSGAASFSFWTSSCAATGSDHAAFGAILAHDPDFGMHAGDLHYRDINVNDPAQFHIGYDQVLDSPGQGALYRNVPIVYVWDDHDYGKDGSSYTSPSRPAAISSFRDRVPHFPLPSAEAVYQTFAYGRVRFIMLDVRSMKGADAVPLIGATQRDWFKDVVANADEPVLIVGTGTPWIGTHADSWYGPWGAHAPLRTELAQWVNDNGYKDRVIFWAGDQHALSYDDGTNNPHGGLYAPVFQTAALDQTGSNKGGTYTRPPVLDRGQFGLWEVTDTGGATITVAMKAYSLATTLLYTESIEIAASPATTTTTTTAGGTTTTTTTELPVRSRRSASTPAFL